MNIKYSHLTKEYLELEYIVYKKSTTQIAKENKCSISAIWKRLQKFSIRIRTMHEALTKYEQVFCKICKKEITRFGKSGLCHSCEKKEFHRKNPGFNKVKSNQCKFGRKSYMQGKKHSMQTKILIGMKSRARLENPKNHPNYIDGRSFLPYSIAFTRKLKQKILNRDNRICQNCHMSEGEHINIYSNTLHVHHIDYNKFNCSEENLISLCAKCNTKANHNRDYWKSFYQQKVACNGI